MTREREWMRNCKDLPSVGRDFGLSASDNDVTLHRYMTSVDQQGTREVQALMQIEVKTRRGKPTTAQMDTLSKLNMFCGQKDTDQGVVRFFVVFLLVMSGVDPDTSEYMWWGVIEWHQIDKQKLIELMRFDRHPRNLKTLAFRRHHASRTIYEQQQTPLGFEVWKPVTHRS
jgi:hypothetical protein